MAVGGVEPESQTRRRSVLRECKERVGFNNEEPSYGERVEQTTQLCELWVGSFGLLAGLGQPKPWLSGIWLPTLESNQNRERASSQAFLIEHRRVMWTVRDHTVRAGSILRIGFAAELEH